MRLRNWQSLLAATMAARAAEPFAWGPNDCATFAADCVLAATGRDPMARWRGAWASEREALRLMAAEGGLAAMVTAVLGEPIAPALAQVGDVGLCQQADRHALCVCGGAHWVMPGERGLVAIAAAQVLQAWRCDGGA